VPFGYKISKNVMRKGDLIRRDIINNDVFIDEVRDFVALMTRSSGVYPAKIT
jgi:hypothetical protein